MSIVHHTIHSCFSPGGSRSRWDPPGLPLGTRMGLTPTGSLAGQTHAGPKRDKPMQVPGWTRVGQIHVGPGWDKPMQVPVGQTHAGPKVDPVWDKPIRVPSRINPCRSQAG